MKCVILAGGFGTRISEESVLKPKPMIEIGGMPILWHIMKIYYHQGIDDFIIAAGYKQEIIKQWFRDYLTITDDWLFDFKNNNSIIITDRGEKWKVTVINTGLETQTAGRIQALKKYIGDEPFFVTYGDGVADIDIAATQQEFIASGKIGLITTYNKQENKGIVKCDAEGKVVSFNEKPEGGSNINIGFMIFNKKIFNCILNEKSSLEADCLPVLARAGELCTYQHKGYWQCMDTLNEKNKLEREWTSGKAPWKIWNG